MSKFDRTIALWLCLVGLLVCTIIVIVRYAAGNSISAVGAGASFVVVGAFTVCIGAIFFGLATDRI